MSCGVTDQRATDSSGDGRRAPAAATAANRNTDSDTDSEADSEAESKGASDDQPERRSRLDEITRQADEQVESDKAKQKQDKQDAREQKKAERAERRQAKKDDKDEKAEKQGEKSKGKGGKPDQGLGGQVSAGVSAVRNRIASIVWLIAVLCSVILAIGALLAALSDNINESNPVVEFINETAQALDGPFGNIITFEGRDDRTKEVLVNWGLAALAYLIVGRILDRLIRT